MTEPAKKDTKDAFTPENVLKIRDYQRLIREHTQATQNTLTVTKRNSIQKQIQTDNALQNQRALAIKVFPIVIAVLAGFLLFLGLFFPNQIVYGTFATPLLLILILKIKADPKKAKTSTLKTINATGKIFKAIITPHPKPKQPKQPSQFISLQYIGKLLIILTITNFALWIGGGFLYRQLFWTHFYGPNFQNIIVLLMSTISAIITIALKPRKPSKRFLYLLLYTVKISLIVISIDMILWTAGWLLYAYNTTFASISTGLYQLELYICLAISTVFILAARYFTEKRLTSKKLTIALLSSCSIVCLILYLQNVKLFFFIALGALLVLFAVFIYAGKLKRSEKNEENK